MKQWGRMESEGTSYTNVNRSPNTNAKHYPYYNMPDPNMPNHFMPNPTMSDPNCVRAKNIANLSLVLAQSYWILWLLLSFVVSYTLGYVVIRRIPGH